MRFQINKASVSLGGKTILDHCTLEIKGKDRIGIVGSNGCGKTTLLHLISGQLTPDRDDKNFDGSIRIARNTSIGILEQNPFLDSDMTVVDYIEAICPVTDAYDRERYEFETEYRKIFTMFGFHQEDKEKKLSEFSGGEQTRLSFIRLLLMKPDILLLDEPTNHLDITAIKWLESYLQNYPKAVVLVSHDRYFLDQVTDVIYEISDGKTRRFAGNYSDYRRQREEEIRIQTKKYKEQQEEIERLDQLIQKFKHKPKKASMARSKKKILERMDKIENPDRYQSYIYPGEIIPAHISGKWIYECKKLEIGYEKVLHTMNLRIRRGQRMGIIGPNGCGKSTFLKTISGKIPPLTGSLIEGNHVEAIYYDQLTGNLDSHDRLLEDFHNSFPAYSLGDCRKILARFLFGPEDMAKEIHMLSGGEKCRYTLAKLLEERPNVLLLDEPTNHLDIPAREVLESAFKAYQGTLIFITHDRYFLNQLADSLLIFDQDQVTYYPYAYGEYVRMREKAEKAYRQGIHSMEEENQALLEGLEAVPKKTRLQAYRMNADQSYCDWQLELAAKDLHAVEKQLEEMVEKMERYCLVDDFTSLIYKQEIKEYYIQSREGNHEDPIESGVEHKKTLEHKEILESDMKIEEESLDWEQMMGQKKALLENYNRACINWYEKWMDYQEEISAYDDGLAKEF